MIRLDNVSKFYYSKGVIATGFSRVSLNFEMGEFVAITGESGSGKSTLLNVISGLDTYEEGEMFIDGKETSHYTEKDFEDYRRRYIGNIFQNFNLVNSYTVYQNIELVMLLNGSKRSEIKGRVNALIEKVGLLEYKNTKASKLSGGQKQRVAIARALAKDTPIIIADEPTGNLDSVSASEIIKLLSEIAKDKLVVIVTHNYDQVEPYVTRKIKMHDGKILEDLKISEHEEISEKPQTSYKNIRPLSQLRLGVRNAFNIPVKFLLITFVFLFIALAVTTELSIFKHEEHQNSTGGWNYYFNNNADNRIVIKKVDKSAFSPEDYEAIAALENVDKIFENDLLVDSSRFIEESNSEFWYSGMMNPIETAEFDTVDIGGMPTKDNEIVLESKSDNYYFSDSYQKEFGSVVGKEVKLYTSMTGEDIKLKIVGVKFNDNSYETYWGDGVFYVSDSVMDKTKHDIYYSYSLDSVVIENKEYKSDTYGGVDILIYPNTNVPSGEAYVGEGVLGYFQNGKAVGKEITVKTTNLYFEDSFNVNVTKKMTKSLFTKITGMQSDEYGYYSNYIFVSAEDYTKMFEKASYQSSVFVKDPLKVHDTAEKLEEFGIDTLVISDTNVSYGDEIIYKLMSSAVTIGLAVALLFISYFVIRIILRSRNIYYSTIRMLGANVGVSRNLLIIDLVTDANIACILAAGIIRLLITKVGTGGGDYNGNMIQMILGFIQNNMGIYDYVGIYVIVIAISVLVSLRYSKKLFAKSTINTYKEEV